MAESLILPNSTFNANNITTAGNVVISTALYLGTTSLQVSASTGGVNANVYSGGSLVRQGYAPTYVESSTAPALAAEGDKWWSTSNSTPFRYLSGGWRKLVASTALYTFTSATFGQGSGPSMYGPTISEARSYISGTPNPSTWYNTYLDMTTQGIMLWTVPASGQYTVQIAGARGGYDMYGGGIGKGRIINATLTLVSGQVIKILTGRRGGYGWAYAANACGSWSTPFYFGGGGGGSFIVDASNIPVLIAGGGGGMGYGNSGSGASTQGVGNDAAGYNDTSGTAGTLGAAGSGASPGGTGGNAGSGSYCFGAGFYQDAPTAGSWNPPTNSKSWANGALGGANYNGSTYWTTTNYDLAGGFGGGNGAVYHGCYLCTGGGAGGYSGGGAGSYEGGGGGGGNFISGSALVTVASVSDGGLNSGDGYVSITKI